MKDRAIEIKERAMGILAVSSIYDSAEIRRNFLRQIRLVHPDGPHRHEQNVPGFTNSDIARLLIQAYTLLCGRNGPTTMLENDDLVGKLLNGNITPIDQTASPEDVFIDRFYDQFRHSIWPESELAKEQSRHKFGGV